MFTVALIQNQSEMSHYGYADARSLIKHLRYSVKLYTAQNIDRLAHELTDNRVDAVVFASNALNDKTIRETVSNPDFAKTFSNYLNSGKGCLILHQLRIAQLGITAPDYGELNFLPIAQKVRLVERPKNETVATGGNLYLTDAAKCHPCLLYPSLIDIRRIQDQCFNFPGLKGLYWHFLDQLSQVDWDILVYDLDDNKGKRPLLAVMRESVPFRIVITSLTLDWQKQSALFENVLTYLVEGKHYTALLTRDQRSSDASFAYFSELLRSMRYPYRLYEFAEIGELTRNLTNGVHSIIVLAPDVKETVLSERFRMLLKERIYSGDITLIGWEDAAVPHRFFVAGRERLAQRMLEEIEFGVHSELAKGFIDGSFWSTVDSLQVLRSIPKTKNKYDIASFNVVQAVDTGGAIAPTLFDLVNAHDRQGSYDGVFGVTCALLWFRGTFLGLDDASTKATIDWIRHNIPDYLDREKALAYHTLNQIDATSKAELEELKKLLTRQDLGRASEVDLIFYLRIAISVDELSSAEHIIRRLQEFQDPTEGYWVDLETTANAVSTMLDARDKFKQHQATRHVPLEMIYRAVIFIQNARDDTRSGTYTYPWDNKISASLKCVQALSKFEELIEQPVQEIIRTLQAYVRLQGARSSLRTALVTLEELRMTNVAIHGALISTRKERETANVQVTTFTETIEGLKRQISETHGRLEKSHRSTLDEIALFWVFIPAVAYFLAAMGAVGLYQGLSAQTTIQELFEKTWVDHLTSTLEVAALFAFVIGFFLKRKLDNLHSQGLNGPR